MKIDLQEKRQGLVELLTKSFFELITLPKEVRPDEKERTGIQVLIREPDTRNLLFFSIGIPSEAAIFFSGEKAVRSHIKGDFSSQNSADPKKMEYAGSVTMAIGGTTIQASASGMKAEEDVALMIRALAYIFNVDTKDVCCHIEVNKGRLPDCFFLPSHYLFKFLYLA